MVFSVNSYMEFNRFQVTRDTFGGFQPVRAVFDGRYKLVLNLLDIDELYDVIADPDELHNRVNDPVLSTVRDQLHAQLMNWMNETFDPLRGYVWQQRPWRKDYRPDWKDTGLARHRWDEPYEEPQCRYNTGMPMNGQRTYSQY